MKNRRSKKFVRSDIQVRSILLAFGLAAGAVAVQSVTMTFVLYRIADGASAGGPTSLDQLPAVLGWSALASLVILTPLILGVTLRWTHRIAGPIKRFETYLEAVRDGEVPESLKLRGGDRFEDIASLLVEAVQAVTRGEEPETPLASLADIAERARHAKRNAS